MKLSHISSLLLLAGGLSSVTPPTGQGRKLNGALPNSAVVGKISGATISSDGEWVAYLADETSVRPELFAVRRDGSAAPNRLNGTLGQAGGFRYEFTPDSLRVVYVADENSDGTFELYSTLPDGVGGPTQLTVSAASGAGVAQAPFHISADSQTVVYRAEHTTPGVVELCRVAVDGSSAPVVLASPPSAAQSIAHFEVTPDDTAAVVLAPLVPGGAVELFLVPLSGATETLRITRLAGGDVDDDFEITPDSARVVYRREVVPNGSFELRSAALDLASSPVVLSGLLVGNDEVRRFVLAPDSQRVAYTLFNSATFDSDLYVVSADTNAPPSVVVTDISAGATFSPDGTTVTYTTSASFSQDLLHAVPSDGSAGAIPISHPTGEIQSWSILDDSQTVLIHGRQQFGGALQRQVVSVPIDASAPPTLLSDAVLGLANVVEFAVTADQATLAYATDSLNEELYATATAAASPSVLLNGPLVPWAELGGGLLLDSDDSAVVYLSSAARAGNKELFSASLDGGMPPTLLNDAPRSIPVVSDVETYTLSPDGMWVVYADVDAVHSVPVDPSAGGARQLSPSALSGLGYGGPMSDLVISPDSRTAYFGYAIANFRFVFRAALDGSEPASILQTAGNSFVGSGRLRDLRLTADGSTLVHWIEPINYSGQGVSITSIATDGSSSPINLDIAEQESFLRVFELVADDTRVLYDATPFSGPSELRSTPVDGSGPVVDLLPASAGSMTRGSLRLAFGRQRVLYCTYDSSTTANLYSTAADGSQAPVLLSSGLPVISNVLTSPLRVSPTDAHVAYTRQGAGGVELYHAAADGSGSPTLLVTLPTPIGLEELVFSPDGSRIVYLADALAPGQAELFSVPVDGSQAPVRVNGPLVAGGAVSFTTGGAPHFQVTDDGTRVVYRADGRTDEVFEFFIAPIEGGGPTIALNPPSSFSAEADFMLTRNSTRLLYRLDGPNTELLSARLNGAGSPRPRSGPFTHPTEVESDYAITRGERFVVYRADQDTDGVVELYAHPFTNRTRPATSPTGPVEHPRQ